MIKGKTKSGFAYELDEDVRDDWELLETLRKVDAGDKFATMDAAKQMLGEKQMVKLKDFCRSKSGRVSATKMVDTMSEILDSLNEAKN